MLSFIKKISLFGWIFLGSIVLALVGFIITCVNLTTGYFSGTSIDSVVLWLSILAIVVGVLTFVFASKNKYVGTIGLIVFITFLSVVIARLVLNYEGVAADLYFIPVNHPETEDTAWLIGLVGFAFILVSIIGAIVASFGASLVKEEVKEEKQVA